MIKYVTQGMSRGGRSKVKSKAKIDIKTQPKFHNGCQAQTDNISQLQMYYLFQPLKTVGIQSFSYFFRAVY